MTRKTFLNISFTSAEALAVALGAGGPARAGQSPEVAAFIESVRTAIERFEGVNVALAEGYIPDPSGMCVSAAAEGLPAEWGGMGIHYMRPDVLKITAIEPRVAGNATNTDFLNPSILLYEPQADGSLVLVSGENLVFEAGWLAAGNSGAPSLLGRGWDHMADDPATAAEEAHGFEAHWDQHVWFRENPAGNLMPFNPDVTCEFGVSAHKH